MKPDVFRLSTRVLGPLGEHVGVAALGQPVEPAEHRVQARGCGVAGQPDVGTGTRCGPVGGGLARAARPGPPVEPRPYAAPRWSCPAPGSASSRAAGLALSPSCRLAPQISSSASKTARAAGCGSGRGWRARPPAGRYSAPLPLRQRGDLGPPAAARAGAGPGRRRTPASPAAGSASRPVVPLERVRAHRRRSPRLQGVGVEVILAAGPVSSSPGTLSSHSPSRRHPRRRPAPPRCRCVVLHGRRPARRREAAAACPASASPRRLRLRPGAAVPGKPDAIRRSVRLADQARVPPVQQLGQRPPVIGEPAPRPAASRRA